MVYSCSVCVSGPIERWKITSELCVLWKDCNIMYKVLFVFSDYTIYLLCGG